VFKAATAVIAVGLALLLPACVGCGAAKQRTRSTPFLPTRWAAEKTAGRADGSRWQQQVLGVVRDMRKDWDYHKSDSFAEYRLDAAAKP
jgi:hypothetical protein